MLNYTLSRGAGKKCGIKMLKLAVFIFQTSTLIIKYSDKDLFLLY